jgi:hypothetical protein
MRSTSYAPQNACGDRRGSETPLPLSLTFHLTVHERTYNDGSKMTDDLAPMRAQAKLYTTAADVLRNNKVDVDNALPAFLNQLKHNSTLLSALATDYLNRVAADIRNAARNAAANTKTAAVDAEEADAVATPGHSTIGAHAERAGGHLSNTVADAEEAKAAASSGPAVVLVKPAGAHPTIPTRKKTEGGQP